MKGQNLSTSKTKIEPEKREHTHKTLWMEQILEQDWQQVCHLMPSMMNTSHVALVVLVHLSSVRRMRCYRVNLLSDLCARHDLRSCDPWRFRPQSFCEGHCIVDHRGMSPDKSKTIWNQINQIAIYYNRFLGMQFFPLPFTYFPLPELKPVQNALRNVEICVPGAASWCATSCGGT
jgi:hypothetical protein